MAVHVIPKQTKVKMELYKGFTLGDVFYILACGAIMLLFVYANFTGHVYIGLAVTAMLLMMAVKSNGIRMYTNVGWLFKFMAFKKSYSKERKRSAGDMKMLIPYTGIIKTNEFGDFIDFKEYYAKVLEIRPINFYLLNETKQNMIINAFANALRRLGAGQYASLIKLNRPLVLDGLASFEIEKAMNVAKGFKNGNFSEREVRARQQIFEERERIINYLNYDRKIYNDCFYLVVYAGDKSLLSSTVNGIASALQSSSTPIITKELKAIELVAFLKANYSKYFDERELRDMPERDYLNWIMPDKVKFKPTKAEIDGVNYCYFTVTDYPLTVNNAWGAALTSVDTTRVCVNFTPLNKLAAERLVDRSLIEMQTQLLKASRLSAQIDKETAVNTMQQLLVSLKNENEQLFDVTMHICCEFDKKKEVKARLKEQGFKYNEMFCRQVDGFVSMNISKRDCTPEYVRGIQTTSLAAFFPFVSNLLQDENGVYLGYGESSVFVNFFKRDAERQNSNMIVIGRSGSGKSFATKTLLANLAADDAKIFVLDPEYEYKELCNRLGGKTIDVASGAKGRFNPFHVMFQLEGDDEEENDSMRAATFEMHLQFLEEFFRLILEGIPSDALETLNNLVIDLYKMKGITAKTDFTRLRPTDYPNFDDLYSLTLKRLGKEKDDYLRNNLKVVLNYVEKFASGGRNSGLWNGPSTISTDENFVLFSFQTLLANRNQQIARAQMLMVFKYLNGEIIKNREYNDKYRKGIKEEDRKRKIIVVVDEAHTFINPKYPIALDFMFDMAKRIRKYSGMQIIITQNIRDFMGSEDMIRQSSAIIAASQYSMIFSLAPNDVTELVKLYKNAGEINENEQDAIATAGTGVCFLITGAMSRSILQIEATDNIRAMFDRNFAYSIGQTDEFIQQQLNPTKASQPEEEVETDVGEIPEDVEVVENADEEVVEDTEENNEE